MVQIRNKDIWKATTHTGAETKTTTVQTGWEDRNGSDTQQGHTCGMHTHRSRKEDNRRQEAGMLMKFRCVREVREKRSVVLKTKPLTPQKMCRHLDLALRKMNKSMAAQKT